MIHVYPENDWITHDTESTDCICEPRIVWCDEETGEALPTGVVIRNAIDGREE